MLLYVSRIDTLPVWPDTVQVLVDVGDSIFPQAPLPFRSRQFVFERRFHSGSAPANAIESCRLASLLVEIHLTQQILDALVDRRFGVLVDIHAAVLIQINPAVVIDAFARVCLVLRRQSEV